MRLAARRRARRRARREPDAATSSRPSSPAASPSAPTSATAPSVDRALAEVEAALGPVDIWVNNAGIAAAAQAARIGDAGRAAARGGGEAGAITTPLDALVRLPDDEWRTMLAVHLDGTFYGTRAAARSMAPRGAGVDRQHRVGLRRRGLHRATRTTPPRRPGVIGFTRAVAKELAVQGDPRQRRRARASSNRPAPASARTRCVRRSGCGRRSAASAAARRSRHRRVPRERRRGLLRRRDAERQRRPRHHLREEANGRTRGRDRRGRADAGRARAPGEGLLQGRPPERAPRPHLGRGDRPRGRSRPRRSRT